MTAAKQKGRKFKTSKQKFDRSSVKTSCAEAILETLSYRSIFKYPLSYNQLYTYLITPEEFTEEDFKKELRSLCKGRKVKYSDDLYYLAGMKPVNWKRRAESSDKLLASISLTLTHLKRIPWIKMIGITGAVAARNAPKDDDIDLFIVTQKNRTWITRLFVWLITKSTGKYPLDGDFRGKVCPNIIVSEENMRWPKDKRNIYVAHEILLLQPIYSKNHTYFKFIKKNKWVFDYFAHLKVNTKGIEIKPSKESTLLDFIETLSMSLQRLYMRKKKTNEIVEKAVIHFNKADHSKSILKKHSDYSGT